MRIIMTSGECDGYSNDSIEMTADNGDTYSNCANPLYECPEDAILERDLISCYSILKAVKIAYEAGKRGEELIIEELEDEDD
jgi:hypothetical protein